MRRDEGEREADNRLWCWGNSICIVDGSCVYMYLRDEIQSLT